MHEEENIALVKRGLEATANGDFATLRTLLAEDTVWDVTGEPAYRGANDVIEHLKRWDESGFEGTVEPEAFFADGNRVVSVEHVQASFHGKTLDTHMVHVFDIRNGKLAHLTEYIAEPEKTLEFMSA